MKIKLTFPDKTTLTVEMDWVPSIGETIKFNDAGFMVVDVVHNIADSNNFIEVKTLRQ